MPGVSAEVAHGEEVEQSLPEEIKLRNGNRCAVCVWLWLVNDGGKI